MRVGQVMRIGAAIALVVAGLVHLDLYFLGYRDAGSVPDFGRSILADAVAFGAVGIAVAVRREWFVRLAGIAVPAATLAGFAYTHSGRTMRGFESSGWEPSPQSAIALVAEVVAIVLLALTFVPSIAASDESLGMRVLAGAALVGVVAFVGLGLYWSDQHATSAVAGGASSVAIADFSFTPAALSVPAGATVTWTNSDAVEHSVLSTAQSFLSPNLAQGQTFEVAFEAPGEYPYICGVHPEMAGSVTVTP